MLVYFFFFIGAAFFLVAFFLVSVGFSTFFGFAWLAVAFSLSEAAGAGLVSAGLGALF